MSSITLSSATRQNLLVAQDTAALLSTTQNRLATGKKVNSALDSPSSFFTAQGLDNRAGDLSNILDSISNGVQVIQAANTGITSLQKLVDNAKSVANQALQATIGYSTKSNVSTTIAGATAADLRGTTAYTSAQASSNILASGAAGGTTAVTGSTKIGGLAGTTTTAPLYEGARTSASVTTKTVTAGTMTGSTILGSGLTLADTNSITINGKTLTFVTSGAASNDGSGNYTIGIDKTAADLTSVIDAMAGTTGTSVGTNKFTIATGTTTDITFGGSSTILDKLGLTAGTTPRGGTQIGTATKLYDDPATGGLTDRASTPFQDGDTLNVNGKTVTFKKAAVPGTAPAGTQVSGNNVLDASGNVTVYMGAAATSTATITDVLHAVDLASGVAYIDNSGTTTANIGQTLSGISGGAIALNSSTGADLKVSGKADILKSLGLTTATGAGPASVTAARTTSAATAASLVEDGSTLNVNGKTITFKNAAPPTGSAIPTGSGVNGNLLTDGNGNSTVFLQNGSLSDVLAAIDLATGVQTSTVSANGAASAPTPAAGSTASSISNGILKISTGTLSDLNVTGTGNALSALGLSGNTGTASSFTASRTSTAGGLAGKTLTFGSLNNGTAVNVTFGDGKNGTVKSLDDLNAKLALNNMQASLDASGKLTISTANDYASSTIGSTDDGGAIGGTAAALFSAAQAPVADVNSQNTRKNLLSQFNQILDNIKTTAQDASFNGVNLLNGDTLKLTFNEKGSSTMNLIGVTFDPSGLGLTKLGQNGLNEFEDISSTNKVISTLTQASTALRSQASTFGSNLSVVQNRQDFNKQIINVLQTGSSKLTDADLNEEAANSQALSTRQSLTVSALSLANQAQQSVLQLLR
jgi:flagellin-like hook-associated protein FlgL